ncbi:hypothetical protein EXN66_Car006814 [Channa argus]|uniref:Uncharacterized protein n=1 Tax=Channa argus TaxID=215402 RepID=A0A6G1PLN9_CHAAH|nr:hypothetical protein EXN66_Car006814 [Channa argus]
MCIWSKLLPDKACTDVWVSTFRRKVLKPVPQALFLPNLQAPPSCSPPDRFSSSSVSRQAYAENQTGAQTQAGELSLAGV